MVDKTEILERTLYLYDGYSFLRILEDFSEQGYVGREYFDIYFEDNGVRIEVYQPNMAEGTIVIEKSEFFDRIVELIQEHLENFPEDEAEIEKYYEEIKNKLMTNKLIKFQYPFPSCNIGFNSYDPQYDLGYIQGVFTSDNRPFIAELWKDETTSENNVTFTFSADDFIDIDINNSIKKNDGNFIEVTPFQRNTKVHIKTAVFNELEEIGAIQNLELLDLLRRYLESHGVIKYETKLLNAIGLLCRDREGKNVIFLNITLYDDGVMKNKCNLDFKAYGHANENQAKKPALRLIKK